jgi:hypothetical protein
MTSVQKRRWVVVGLLVGSCLLLTACQTRTPALELVLDRYPDLGSGIYEKLSRWEEVLGEPETVPQADGGTTFFYWPERGIAVFTHPLYEGQYRGKEQEERTVTSVILPLRKSFRPGFLPVEDEVVVRFDQLLDTRRFLPDSTPSRPPTRSGDTAYVDLISSPFRKTVERLHLVDGEPIAIEIRDTWWLSRYD